MVVILVKYLTRLLSKYIVHLMRRDFQDFILIHVTPMCNFSRSSRVLITSESMNVLETSVKNKCTESYKI